MITPIKITKKNAKNVEMYITMLEGTISSARYQCLDREQAKFVEKMLKARLKDEPSINDSRIMYAILEKLDIIMQSDGIPTPKYIGEISNPDLMKED